LIVLSFDWGHAGPSFLAAFLASLVEFVEALTVILAVGSVRGWRGAIGGAVVALVLLLGIVGVLGGTLVRLPLSALQMIVGPLLLLFGLRWLRKAILRSAGVIPLHDETAAFAKETAAMHSHGSIGGGWDRIAFAASFQITMLEGMEVVFIVIAVGAGGVGLLLPASLGACAALVLVTLLGIVVHRPLARVPENALKFVVGILLSAFGTFWAGEGMGLAWTGGDWSILTLAAGYALVAALAVAMCRSQALAMRKI
jgi:Ca2+/H+ antiporter, TMEM165/GDT1 family